MSLGQVDILRAATIDENSTTFTAVSAGRSAKAIGRGTLNLTFASSVGGPTTGTVDLEYTCDGTNYEKLQYLATGEGAASTAIQFNLTNGTKSYSKHLVVIPRGAMHYRANVTTAPGAGESYVNVLLSLTFGVD